MRVLQYIVNPASVRKGPGYVLRRVLIRYFNVDDLMSDTVNALSTYSSSLASVIVGSTVDAAGVQFVKNQEN